MQVSSTVNLGTVVPIVIFLLAQTIAGAWWGGKVSANMTVMRDWQERQDIRVLELEKTQLEIMKGQVAIETMQRLIMNRLKDVEVSNEPR